MGENLFIGISFRSHHGCAYLAKAHSVAPAGSIEDDPVIFNHRLKSRAFKVAFRKYPPDFQFFSHYERTLRTYNPEFIYPSGFSPLQSFDILYISKPYPALLLDQGRQFFVGIYGRPAVEVDGLLVLGVQDLGQYLLGAGVAEAMSVFGMSRRVRKRLKIRHIPVFPAHAEPFHPSSAAFREAGVA